PPSSRRAPAPPPSCRSRGAPATPASPRCTTAPACAASRPAAAPNPSASACPRKSAGNTATPPTPAAPKPASPTTSAPATGSPNCRSGASAATPRVHKRVAWLLPQEAAGFELPRSVAGKGVPLTDDSKRSGGGQGHSLSRESALPKPGAQGCYDDFESFIPSTVIVPSFSSTA